MSLVFLSCSGTSGGERAHTLRTAAVSRLAVPSTVCETGFKRIGSDRAAAAAAANECQAFEDRPQPVRSIWVCRPPADNRKSDSFQRKFFFPFQAENRPFRRGTAFPAENPPRKVPSVKGSLITPKKLSVEAIISGGKTQNVFLGAPHRQMTVENTERTALSITH